MKYWILHSVAGPAYPKWNKDERIRRQIFSPGIDSDKSLKNWLEENEEWRKYRVPPPLKFDVEIEKNYGDTFKASYYGGTSLMRDDLIEAILSADVDNIETFEAIVTDTVSGEQFTNYKYVHIIGETEYIFDKQAQESDGYAINYEMMNNLHIARMKGGHEIVIDRVVREAIEKSGIEDMRFKYRYSLFDKFFD
jgi:hypothetical protein